MHILARVMTLGLFLVNVTLTPAVSEVTDSKAGSDAQHNFDFNLGSWAVHARYRHQADDGSIQWSNLDGTARVSSILDGSGQLEEINASGPQKSFRVAILFLYNGQTHEWSKTLVSNGEGVFDSPMLGGLNDGVVAFYDQEFYHGKTAFMRTVWSGIAANSQHVEDAFSYDAGKSWTSYFIADFSRVR
jgi:hypothetical protein